MRLLAQSHFYDHCFINMRYISHIRGNSNNHLINCIKKATVKNPIKNNQRDNSSQNSNATYNNANNGKCSSIFVILLTVPKADYRYDQSRKANKAIAIKNYQRDTR